MSTPFSFHVDATDIKARTGQITTSRGTIHTPAFMPVGTAATVKAMYPETIRTTGTGIILSNTYHLMLRPGAERIAQLGGLHEFMNWSGPILTDSGGFQVMSLAKLRKITEDGVTFRSHIDGSQHALTPKRAIEIQCLLGADIQMVFDECTSYPCEFAEAENSMELSLRWAERSKTAFASNAASHQALFGIVQGSVFPALRERSANALVDMALPGYAIGGLAVGEGREIMLETLDMTVPHLPVDKPRYLMGVGTPDDILCAVRLGIDMFDCVMPTRAGRHGQAFTWDGRINVRNAIHADDAAPLDGASPCPAASQYARAYLHHLIKSGEMLGSMLLTWANVHFYQDFMRQIRAAIAESQFDGFYNEYYGRWTQSAGENGQGE